MNNDSGYVFQLLEELGFSEFAARSAQFLLGRPLAIAMIVVAGFFVSRFASRVTHRWVESLVARSALPGRAARSVGRAKTLASVSASIVRVVVWSMTGLLVLGQLGIDLGPFLAGASIIGFALGFGAQTLVRDYLAGFFILAEDQFGVGDLVTLGDSTGTVEEVTLRVTRIRASDGTVWFVPNGEIRKVGNSAKDWSRAIVDIALLPGVDVRLATVAITEAVGGLKDDAAFKDALLETPEVLGVEEIGPDGTTIRVAARTHPQDRARVARELRVRAGTRLRAEGYLPTNDETPSATPPGETVSD